MVKKAIFPGLTFIAGTVLVMILTSCAGAVNAPAPTPSSTATSVLVVTPTPTATPKPTATAEPTPTPEPTMIPLAAMYGIDPERVQVIQGDLPYGEPSVLVGCHAHSISSVTFVFTRDGSMPRDLGDGTIAQGVAIIMGPFVRLEKDGCYEMAVKPKGTGAYRALGIGYGSKEIKIREYRLMHHADGARGIASVRQWQIDRR
jgi:hypothetical protein